MISLCSSPRLQARLTAKAAVDVSRLLCARSGTSNGTSLQRAKALMGQSVGREAVTACRKDAFRWRLLGRNICQEVHPVQLLPRLGVAAPGDMALRHGGWQGQGEIYQSAELVPRIAQWEQKPKSGQMGRSFSRMLMCMRAFGSVCSVLTDMLAHGRGLATLGMGAVQHSPGEADVSRGQWAYWRDTMPSLPSLTLDGGLAKGLQPLQGGAVPAARVKLALALEDSQVHASLHRLHGFTASRASTCLWQTGTCSSSSPIRPSQPLGSQRTACREVCLARDLWGRAEVQLQMG